MSNKKACPGCDSYTSDLYRAYEEGGDCPCCGLPHDAWRAVATAQERYADDARTAELEGALVAKGQAQAECARLREKLTRAEYHVRLANELLKQARETAE